MLPIPMISKVYDIYDVYTGGRRTSNITTRKYNSTGSLIWSRDHGAEVYGIAVDTSGNVYTGGERTTAIGGVYATTRKYDSSGNLIWSVDHSNTVFGIAVDIFGNVYTVGYRQIVTGGYANTRKYDSSGNLLWSKDHGGTNVRGIAVDSSGNVYTAGDRTDVIGGVFATTRKYDSSGNLLWSVDHGETVLSIEVDSSGNVYTVSGDVSSIGNKTTRKYDSSGNLLWSLHDGKNRSIALDSSGKVYIGGGRGTIGGVFATTRKYDSSGNLIWSRDHGAEVFGISVDSSGNVYTGGNRGTNSSNLTTRKYDSSGNLLWSADHGDIVRSIDTFPPNKGAFLDPEDLFVSYILDNEIKIGKISNDLSDDVNVVLTIGFTGTVQDMDYHKPSKRLVVSCRDSSNNGMVFLINTETNTLISSLSIPLRGEAVCFKTNGDILVGTGTSGLSTYNWDGTSWVLVRTLAPAGNQTRRIRFIESDNTIAYSGFSGTGRALETATSASIWRVSGAAGTDTGGFAVSPMGNTIFFRSNESVNSRILNYSSGAVISSDPIFYGAAATLSNGDYVYVNFTTRQLTRINADNTVVYWTTSPLPGTLGGFLMNFRAGIDIDKYDNIYLTYRQNGVNHYITKYNIYGDLVYSRLLFSSTIGSLSLAVANRKNICRT